MKNLRLKIRPMDIAVIVLILVIAVISEIVIVNKNRSSEDLKVRMIRDGELVYSVSLNEDREVHIEGQYHNTVRIKNKKVSVTEADCPGKDCMHTGEISSEGSIIVCLPNRLEIRITGNESSPADVDAIAE